MRTAFVPRWLVTRDRFSNGFLAPILAWQNCIRKCILHIDCTTSYNLPRLINVRHSIKKDKLEIFFFFFFFVIYEFCNVNSLVEKKKKKNRIRNNRCNSISKFNNTTSRRKIIFYALAKSVLVITIQRASPSYFVFTWKRECFFHITIEMIV